MQILLFLLGLFFVPVASQQQTVNASLYLTSYNPTTFMLLFSKAIARPHFQILLNNHPLSYTIK